MSDYFTISPEVGSPDRWEALRARIFSMERRSNWDHRRAKAIRKRDCAAAASFLRAALWAGAPVPDHIAPSPKGEVTFSWRLGGNLVFAAVSAAKADRVYFQWGGPTDGPKEGTVSIVDFASRLASMV